VLARYSFVLHSSPRPTVFLTWLIVPGIVVAWRRGERQAAIQALMLLLTAIGIDALGVRRGLKSEYFIFTDPLIILSGAMLLDSRRVIADAAPALPPAKMKSMARSLLKSEVTRPAPVASMPSPVSAEMSVNVLFPLLRQRTLWGLPPADAPSGDRVMYRSRSPSWS